MVNLMLIAKVCTFLGTIMIAFAALRVHHRFLNERKIDSAVFAAMKVERFIGLTGVGLTFIGFIFDVYLLFI